LKLNFLTCFKPNIPFVTVTAPQSCKLLKFNETSNSSTFLRP